MLIALSVPAFAETEGSFGTLTLSLEGVEQQWLERSPDYVKINSDLALADETYTDLFDAAKLMGEHLNASNFPDYNTLMNTRDRAKCAFDIAKVQYDSIVQNGIFSAKKAFLVCYQDDLNISIAKQNLEIKKAQLTNYAVALQNGYISQSLYDSLKSAVDGLQNSLTALSTKREADYNTLRLKLGIDLETNLVLKSPDFGKASFDAIITIDFESDLKFVKENSVAIKVLTITRDSMASGNYANHNQKLQADLNLKNAKTALEPNFTLTYQNLQNQYTELLTAYSNFDTQKDKYENIKKQFAQGYISSLALSNASLDFSNSQATLFGKEAAMYLSYFSYKNAALGY